MDSILSPRTRRHLLKLAAAGAAVMPLVALTANKAHARDDNTDQGPPTNPGADCKNKGTKCCVLKGTHIATPMGETPVEELRIGDEICTLDGIRKVKWIGCDRFRAPDTIVEGVTPIKVARFALDDATPARDLYLSPGHCLYADGVLIPVEFLVNGTSISYRPPSEDAWIAYYHLECERHEIVFAEGATVESYRGADRGTFENLADYERLYGPVPEQKTPYAPIAGYNGGFDELKGLVRSIVSNFVDVRDPIQIFGDRIDARSRSLNIS
jgi:hypothetical protein